MGVLTRVLEAVLNTTGATNRSARNLAVGVSLPNPARPAPLVPDGETTALVAHSGQPSEVRRDSLCTTIVTKSFYGAGALIPGLAPAVTMTDLITDLFGILKYHMKDPTFRQVWDKIIKDQDALVGSLVVTGSILAYLGMGPFNMYNMVQLLKDLVKMIRGLVENDRNALTPDERGRLTKIIAFLDCLLAPFLSVAVGLPVGAMLAKACEEMMAFKTVWTYVLGTISAGFPIYRAVTFSLGEVDRTIDCAVTFFNRDRHLLAAQLGDRAANRYLRHQIATALNILEETPVACLNKMSLGDDVEVEKVIAQLLDLGRSKLKEAIAEFVLFPAFTAAAWIGSDFFQPLGKGAALAIMSSCGIDTNRSDAQELAEVLGSISRCGFAMMWSLFLKPVFIRPLERVLALYSNWKGTEGGTTMERLTNCTTWGELGCIALSAGGAAAIGGSNLVFIQDEDPMVELTKRLSAVISSALVSLQGVTGFLKLMHWLNMTLNVYDKVGFRLSELQSRLAHMPSEETRSIIDKIESHRKDGAPHNHNVEPANSDEPDAAPSYQV